MSQSPVSPPHDHFAVSPPFVNRNRDDVKEEHVERVLAMMRQERTGYSYTTYLPQSEPASPSSSPTRSAREIPLTPASDTGHPYSPGTNVYPTSASATASDGESGTDDENDAIRPLNASWREKICQWSYNVVDHFDLPRELVAISLDYFDRFLATQNNRCSGNQALLVSLTTLHIAIKIHSDRRLKISTLASLSRGQFGPEDIEEMEWSTMQSLGWKLHPPTMFSFISNFVVLLPDDVPHHTRKEIFEQSIYIAELSVCDSYFVTLPTSVVSFAAIRNVFDAMPLTQLSQRDRERYLFEMDAIFHLHDADPMMIASRDRLYSMFEPRVATSSAPTVTPTSSEDDMDMACDYEENNFDFDDGDSVMTPTGDDGDDGFRNVYNDRDQDVLGTGRGSSSCPGNCSSDMLNGGMIVAAQMTSAAVSNGADSCASNDLRVEDRHCFHIPPTALFSS